MELDGGGDNDGDGEFDCREIYEQWDGEGKGEGEYPCLFSN